VLVRNNEQMAADIRVNIEDDEIVGSAVENKVSMVSIGVGLQITKNAAV
jgi:hypothetical protein